MPGGKAGGSPTMENDLSLCKMVPQHGKRFSIAGNHFPPWKIVSRRFPRYLLTLLDWRPSELSRKSWDQLVGETGMAGGMGWAGLEGRDYLLNNVRVLLLFFCIVRFSPCNIVLQSLS